MIILRVSLVFAKIVASGIIDTITFFVEQVPSDFLPPSPAPIPLVNAISRPWGFPRVFRQLTLKALSHGAIFLATCSAILLLRDVNL